ncbi:ubiquinone biosynthesis hydroxylase [Caballeronia calidae]|uniref:Ubiquinone biosynthesis hydroxylase n=2 Tax=Caballeronia calidae TaxID=1777139 RepID=A0A158ED84_9BURK|nr:5-demethoxyubiquinol-8 5-hydroxylase UbiM [Caballeronia calidae]SAL04680.1 ubiquinone biosynthesis hydroxylase [Caballeronia calidae]
MMHTDVVIVGAGPAGLCLANALGDAGLSIALVEQQSREALCEPAFDGREIALTQKSVAFLKTLGVWKRIDAHAKSRLADARIFNGSSPFALKIGHALSGHAELGWLVPNHLIRRAAFEAVEHLRASGADIRVMASERVIDVDTDATGARVQLESGETLMAQLVVAADSRYSATRRMMGIAAAMHDFGKSMLVCCMTHDGPHDHAAWEWFGHRQTLALLPMNPDPESGAHRSSVVVTLAARDIERLSRLDGDAFSREIERRFERRLGGMALRSTRHVYPLVSVYPKRFVAKRFATVGDAAVGMHPVTAHGFNFGLDGIETLSRAILDAHAARLDIAGDALLARYEQKHRQATRPLYMMTRLITEVYTRDSMPALIVRDAMLRIGERLTPFKRAVAMSLAGR